MDVGPGSYVALVTPMTLDGMVSAADHSPSQNRVRQLYIIHLRDVLDTALVAVRSHVRFSFDFKFTFGWMECPDTESPTLVGG